MRAYRTEIVLGVMTATMCTLAVLGWRAASSSISETPLTVGASPRQARAVIDSAVIEALRHRDPFQFGVGAGASVNVGSAQVLPRNPNAARPALVLRAIVGGPPWQAVIDGVPGEPAGAVVAPGTQLGGLHVVTISRDSVVVRTSDSTWAFTLDRGRP